MNRYLQHSIIIGILLVSGGVGGEALAHDQETDVSGFEPDASVSLALNAARYRLNTDAIEAVLTLAVEGLPTATAELDCLNGVDDDSDAKIDRADEDCQVVTSDGVSTNEELYHLRLVFTDPHGQPIVADQIDLLVDELESPPPNVFRQAVGNAIELLPGEAVETLLPIGPSPFQPFALTVTLADARTEYTLPQAGFYSVQARIPYRDYDPNQVFLVDGQEVALLGAREFGGMLISKTVTFALVADADGDGYCFPEQHPDLCVMHPEPDCNDEDPDVNPGADEVSHNGVDDDCNPATVDVEPLVNGTVILKVKLDTERRKNHSGSSKDPLVNLPVRLYDWAGSCLAGVSMPWQNYENIYENCPTATSLIGETEADGIATFSVTPASYLGIAKYVVAGGKKTRYPGVSVGEVGSGETKKSFIKVKSKSSNRKHRRKDDHDHDDDRKKKGKKDDHGHDDDHKKKGKRNDHGHDDDRKKKGKQDDHDHDDDRKKKGKKDDDDRDDDRKKKGKRNDK
jgi:hypothetical protein